MCGKDGNMYFEFRIIVCAGGVEIIDRKQNTFYHQLTPYEMVEYLEMDNQLEFMDRMERKAKAGVERQRKLVRNPLWRLACLCGLV